LAAREDAARLANRSCFTYALLFHLRSLVSPTLSCFTYAQAAIAIGNLGPAAKSSIPNLKACMVQPKYDPPINATAEQLDASMKQGDLIRACRDALGKVQK
jgi:hypothetical protein